MSRAVSLFIALLGITLISCASEPSIETIPPSRMVPGQAVEAPTAQFPSALPADGVQPWEELDANGNVFPAERSASSININTDFTPGVERFLESGDVADNLEATRLNGTDSSGTSYAMYRISMGSEQPGIVSVDANLLSGEGYYVGLSNYGTDRWDWHGPFTDNHVRLQAVTDASGELTSALGNTFVTVLVAADSSADVIGVGVNQYDLSDATAPSTPLGLAATPVAGGLLLEWSPVLDSDLAGYAIHYASHAFISPDSAGVMSIPYLEGSTRHLLGGLDRRTYVRISTVDFAGNRSAASDLVDGIPLAGDPLPVHMETNAVSGGVDADITLAASGAASYDWDLDGDGVFEIQADPVGIQQAYTSATGIIRPRVRGLDSESIALGGVSLIITGNTRPVASATATPQFGDAPLDVTFTGSAEDSEDALESLTFAWDFDGDGFYEDATDTLTPTQQTYSTPGLYNAKFRATDTDGAWDVDTVAVSSGDNLPPHAEITYITPGVPTTYAALLDASGSFDLDGSIALYEWDWDADGTYDEDSGTDPFASHDFQSAGIYSVNLRVTDNQGGASVASASVPISGPGNEPPVAALQADKEAVEKGEVITFSAAASSDPDGSIVSYQWDLNGNMAFNESGNGENLYEGSPAAQASWSDPGIKNVSVMAIDDQGAAGFASMEPLVHGWVTKQLFSWGEPIDDPEPSFVELDLCEVNGNPSISIATNLNADLRFIRALDANGTDWPASLVSVEADPAFVAGSRAQMKVVAGKPAMLVYKVSEQRMAYFRALDANGDSWGSPVMPDPASNGHYNYSMEIVNGRPAISYTILQDTLNFVRALDSTGSSWGAGQMLDDSGIIAGDESYLAIVDGYPAITSRMHNGTWDILRFQRATDANGDNWGGPMSLTAADGSGYDSNLMVFDGLPTVIYKNGSNLASFIRAADPQGSTWGTASTVNPAVISGHDMDMASIDGMPAIVSRGITPTKLFYTAALDPAGVNWQSSVEIAVGVVPRLISLHGRPAVAYCDFNVGNPSYVYFAIMY